MKFLSIFILLNIGLLNIAINAHANMLSTNTTLNDENFSALSIRWWQWVNSAPDDLDPIADETGEHCDYAQSDDIFFLAPSYRLDKVTRNCTIPKNQYIFFPVISLLRWDIDDGLSCQELKDQANTAINSAQDMLVELDRKKLQFTRAATRDCFNILGDDDHYTSDGYWVLLKPLPQGTHVLRFKGQIGANSAMEDEYKQDIEYIINIE